MRRIRVGSKYALVDTDDYLKTELLRTRKFHIGSSGYAVRNQKYKNSRKDWQMTIHHLVMGTPPKGMQVDHINGNKLDNRKENLRFVTVQQNQMNRGITKVNRSGFKGVFIKIRKSGIKYTAMITIKGRQLWLGSFKDKFEAALAYDRVALEHFGPFTKLNLLK